MYQEIQYSSFEIFFIPLMTSFIYNKRRIKKIALYYVKQIKDEKWKIKG